MDRKTWTIISIKPAKSLQKTIASSENIFIPFQDFLKLTLFHFKNRTLISSSVWRLEDDLRKIAVDPTTCCSTYENLLRFVKLVQVVYTFAYDWPWIWKFLKLSQFSGAYMGLRKSNFGIPAISHGYFPFKNIFDKIAL